MLFCFFFNDTATTEIYTLSLHDALPISLGHVELRGGRGRARGAARGVRSRRGPATSRRRLRHLSVVDGYLELGLRIGRHIDGRSEEHTSELQSRQYLVCRLLLEKKKKTQ